MRFPIRVVVLVWLALLSSPVRAQAETRLRLHGSNTIGERLAPALVDAWLRTRGYARIERTVPARNELRLRADGRDGSIEIELRAHGTSTGFEDLLEGRADLAMASRPISREEASRGSRIGVPDWIEQEAVIALDGIAIIVHPSNPLRRLDIAQARAVFSGAVRDWSQLSAGSGRIELHARDANSGTWETFRTLVLGSARLRSDARRYESTEELSRAVAADRAAIGFVGLAGVGEARALAIADGGAAMLPSRLGVAVEDYPLSRRLYLYRSEPMPPLAKDLLEFALAAAGQEVVERVGFVSQQVRGYPGALREDAPEEYQGLVVGAERLSLNFRFGTGSSLLDSKALRDLDRLSAFVRQAGNRSRPLILLGFADAGESSPYQALTLSNDRVDYIASRLEERGVSVQRVRGMGGAAPVASNDTHAGRHRNRRVEVWLGGTGRALPMGTETSP